MKKARAFPKFLITLSLFALTAYILYTLCWQTDTAVLIGLYEQFGAFICKYDMVLIGIILAVNLVELIDMVACGKRDETINVNYEYMQGHMSLFTMFKHFFAPMFCKGPYIFATEESKSSLIRMVIGFVSGAVKYVYWLAILLVGCAMTLNMEFYDAVLYGNPDYWYTAMILYLCINCNIFLFALISMLPMYQTREYTLVTYYSDGSSTSSRQTSSNFIAIVILSAIIYFCYSAYYIFPLSSKLNRCVETLRFKGFVNSSRSNVCILDYYRHK